MILFSHDYALCYSTCIIRSLSQSILAVVRALQSPHAEVHAQVVEEGVFAIEHLASGDATNIAQLGEHGACKGVYLSWFVFF